MPSHDDGYSNFRLRVFEFSRVLEYELVGVLPDVDVKQITITRNDLTRDNIITVVVVVVAVRVYSIGVDSRSKQWPDHWCLEKNMRFSTTSNSFSQLSPPIRFPFSVPPEFQCYVSVLPPPPKMPPYYLLRIVL